MVHVAVVGGGFGGLSVVKELLKKPDVDITLIDKDGVFVFIPMLPDIALGFESIDKWSAKLNDIFHTDRVKVVIDEVTKIDFDKQSITTKKKKTPTSYDKVVVAAGATDNYFNTPGAKEHCWSMKTVQDAHKVFAQITKAIESYKANEKVKGVTKELTYVVIGAGPTGIELATAIAHKLDAAGIPQDARNITVINAASEILPIFSKGIKNKATKYVQKAGIKLILNARVTEVKKGVVKTQDGQQIKGNTLFWTAGVKPIEIKAYPETTVQKGHFMCEQTCDVIESTNALALGDVAAVPDPKIKFVPKVAQAAMKQAKIVAQNAINKEQQQFFYKPEGYMMSLGDADGIVDMNGPTFSGPLAVLFRKKVYSFKHKALVRKVY